MTEAALVHTHEVFKFTAHASIDCVFPLFGADKERLWAPHWNPVFVWPAQADDQQGMVFTVAHGDRTAIWVNTVLDPISNTLQYVSVIPEVVVTVITLGLTVAETRSGGRSTHVAVTYDRTPLSAAANEIVHAMAARDRKAGLEWGEQINSYLSAHRHHE